jgi:hypothetical protein
MKSMRTQLVSVGILITIIMSSMASTVQIYAQDSSILVPFVAPTAVTSGITSGGVIEEKVRNTFLKSLANQLLQKIITGTVNWVNSGFDGNPFYVENTSLFKSNVFYQQAALVADRLYKDVETGYNRLVLQTLGAKGIFEKNSKFTLDERLGRDSTDFREGREFDWTGYLALGEDSNNPFSAVFNAQNEILKGVQGQIDTTKGNLERELEQGKGFLGARECAKYADLGDSTGSPTPSGNGTSTGSGGGTGIEATNANFELSSEDIGETDPTVQPNKDGTTSTHPNVAVPPSKQCLEWKVMTPGSVVADQLASALGIPANQTGMIKSIEELAAQGITMATSTLLDMGLSALGGAIAGDEQVSTEPSAEETFNNITSSVSDENIVSSSSNSVNWQNAPTVIDIGKLLYGPLYGLPTSARIPNLGVTEIISSTGGTASVSLTTQFVKMGMIERIERAIKDLEAERAILEEKIPITIMDIDQQCLLGPDRGFMDRFSPSFSRQLVKEQRKATTGSNDDDNEKHQNIADGYEILAAFLKSNVVNNIGFDINMRKYKNIVDEISSYNNRLDEVERQLVELRTIYPQVLALAAAYNKGVNPTRDENEIALMLNRISNSGKVPTVESMLDQVNYLERTTENNKRLSQELVSCNQEILKPEYNVRRLGDKLQLLYCPMQGLNIKHGTLKVPTNQSEFFKDLFALTPGQSTNYIEDHKVYDALLGPGGDNPALFGMPKFSTDRVFYFYGGEHENQGTSSVTAITTNPLAFANIAYGILNNGSFVYNYGTDDSEKEKITLGDVGYDYFLNGKLEQLQGPHCGTNNTAGNDACDQVLAVTCSSFYRSNITDYKPYEVF